MSHFCSKSSAVSVADPSNTLIQELSTYCGRTFAKNDEVDGATSEGFRTTVFPAAIAPITGSMDNTGEEK